MLKIRPDQMDALAAATVARRRREVAAAFDQSDADAELRSHWFDFLTAVGIAETRYILRALALLRHYRLRSGYPADWMLMAVLSRTTQTPAARLAFAERHLLPRLVDRDEGSA